MYQILHVPVQYFASGFYMKKIIQQIQIRFPGSLSEDQHMPSACIIEKDI